MKCEWPSCMSIMRKVVIEHLHLKKGKHNVRTNFQKYLLLFSERDVAL